MGRFNEELVKAGIMLAGDGLKPSSQGKRVAFDGPSRTVIDGPFAETRELVAGFWLWEVKDMDEAVEWVKRCPNPMSGPSEIEIRPFYEMADFGEVADPGGRRAGTSGVREKTVGPLSACLPRAPGVRRLRERDCDGHANPTGRSRRSSASSGRGSSPAWPGWCATWAWPRSWRRTPSSRPWPSGRGPACRRNPGAWLMAAAKRRAIDGLRRDRMLRGASTPRSAATFEEDERAASRRSRRRMDDDVGDELLGLIFAACHPVLSPEARAALTLRLIGGLTTDEIARAFLVERGDRRPAHRPGEAGARQGRPGLRGAAGGGPAGRGSPRCWRSST